MRWNSYATLDTQFENQRRASSGYTNENHRSKYVSILLKKQLLINMLPRCGADSPTMNFMDE